MKSEKEQPKDFKKPKNATRRQFLKSSLGIGAVTVLGTVLGNEVFTGVKSAVAGEGSNGSNTQTEAMDVLTHDNMPVKIAKDYKRFNQMNTIFCRGNWDQAIMPHYKAFKEKTAGILPDLGGEGWTQLDRAYDRGGWAITDYAAPGSASGLRDSGVYSWTAFPVFSTKYDFKSPEMASSIIKKAGSEFGASLVGIAEYDERWTYEKFFDYRNKENASADFPFKVTHVIVLAHEMDYEGYHTTPSLIQDGTTGIGYSAMAEVAHKLATFVRRLGYNAIASGNDTALSVPMAIQAGLGELGRLGTLVTPKYGPRVRLSKIFTDLPLKTDKPITFGVREFCESCNKCAQVCPSKAISTEKKPTMSGHNISNCSGVEKWYVDGEKCIKFWGENGGSCASCIAVCPYNKPQAWNHDLSKLMARTPARPLLKTLDDVFGYGKTYNEKAISDFWNK